MAVTITWLGHATFRVDYDGKVMLIDPWVEGNPVCPTRLKSFDRIDLMLITHGHSDHFADAVALAKKHDPLIVCNFEIYQYMAARGLQKFSPMNKGGTVEVDGLRITMTHAFHSSTITDEKGNVIPAGEPAGFVVRFPDGFTLYDAGDTAVFGDMRIIGELYRPSVALLPIGSRFTMDPREAAYATRLLGVKHVIPMHYGTFDLLTGTPEQLRQELHGQEVIVHALKPGDSIESTALR
ncbi:MAG: UPF0173 metal-dependent hydrolase [Candidatus Poribacteria bacterium]|nr:MAG: UPF0173 metal-dependent hydrolase [Candidatus Poribacteria bacterium]